MADEPDAPKPAGPRRPTYYETYPHGNVEAQFCSSFAPRRLAAMAASCGPGADCLEVGAALCVNVLGQILVGFNCKRQVWDVPQGVVEDGDAVVAGQMGDPDYPAQRIAAERELLEETGLAARRSHPVASFTQLNPEFAGLWRTHLYLVEDYHEDSSVASNLEPGKCEGLAWRAPCQIPYPRGLSLRAALVLLGRSE